MREATTQRRVDYFRLPRPLWRKLKKCLPKKRNNTSREAAGRGLQTAPLSTASGTCCGRDVSGRPFIEIGLGWERVSSMSVSRGGGGMGFSRS